MQMDWEQRYIDSDTPWDSGAPSPHLKNFLSEEKVKSGRVLEIGCGTGTNAIFLAQLGFEVTAIDLSKTALERAREKAAQAKVKVNFVEADVTAMPDLGGPFPFIFDRGTYHVVRKVNLTGFQKMLTNMVAPAGLYLVLAGNGNTSEPPEQGPPTVRANEIVSEIEHCNFDLLELKEIFFHGVKVQGKEITPLAWYGLFKKRSQARTE